MKIANYRSSPEAQRARAKKRAEFYKKYPALKTSYTRKSSSANNVFQRQIAPFVLLVHVFTLIFLTTWIYFSFSTTSSTQEFHLGFGKQRIAKLEVNKGNQLYDFQLRQTLSGQFLPEYSELEIEILRSDLDHVYSFYKDLWREAHSNGEGGTSVYSDNLMKFKLVFDQPGTYYLRPNSYNENNGDIVGSMTQKSRGNVYINRFFYTFAIGSFLLFIFRDFFGSPKAALNEVRNFKRLRKNKAWLVMLTICTLSWGYVIYINLTFTGFAKGGEETVLPSRFYPTEKTKYLG